MAEYYQNKGQQYNRGNNRPYQNSNQSTTPKPVFPDKLPDGFVDQAEKLMKYYYEENRDHKKSKITSTKIRKLFGLFTDIYNEVKREDATELKPEYLQSLSTARIRLVYECGRSGKDKDVNTFVTDAKILEYMKQIGTSRAEFMRFHQYFEALVAYHRYYFGDEKMQ